MMLTRLTPLSFSLFLVAALPAQETKPTADPKTQPTESELQTEETGIEETPEQRIEKLKAELAEVNAEFARLEQIKKSGGVIAMVRRKLENTTREVPSFTPKALLEAQRPRLLDAAEKGKYPPTTLFVVKGTPVVQSDYDRVYKFLQTFQTDESAMRRTAMRAIAKQKAAMIDDPQSLLRTQQRCRDVVRMMGEGQSFDEVCAEMSECDSRESKGVMSGLGRGSMDPVLMQVIFNTEPGNPGAMMPSTIGYHYVEVLAKHKGETEADDKVDIRHILIRYSPNVDEIHKQVETGAVEVAFREQHDLDLFLR